MVAKGFHQHLGIDFFETFSHVVKASTIRVVLSIVVSKGWQLCQLDFNNAFLIGRLEESVYMTQPPGYINPSFLNHVCKLDKAIYGFKQSPRAWNTTLSRKLLSWGFVNLRSEFEYGFILNQEKYVDDLLHKLQLQDLKPTSSPSVVGKHLSAYEGDLLDNPFLYRSTIGALQY